MQTTALAEEIPALERTASCIDSAPTNSNICKTASLDTDLYEIGITVWKNFLLTPIAGQMKGSGWENRGKSEKTRPFPKLSKNSNTWLLKFLQINKSLTTSSLDEPPPSDQQEGRTCTTTRNDPELIRCTKQRISGEYDSFIIFSKPVLILYTFLGTLSSVSFPGTLDTANVQFSELYHLILVNQHICMVLGRAGHISIVKVLFQWLMYTSTMCTLKTKMQRHRSREKQVYSCEITAGCMRLVNNAAHCNLFERK